jgi:hypothetical protein
MVSTDTGSQGKAMGIAPDGALLMEVDGVSTAVRAGGVRVESRSSENGT